MLFSVTVADQAQHAGDFGGAIYQYHWNSVAPSPFCSVSNNIANNRT